MFFRSLSSPFSILLLLCVLKLAVLSLELVHDCIAIIFVTRLDIARRTKNIDKKRKTIVFLTVTARMCDNEKGGESRNCTLNTYAKRKTIIKMMNEPRSSFSLCVQVYRYEQAFVEVVSNSSKCILVVIKLFSFFSKRRKVSVSQLMEPSDTRIFSLEFAPLAKGAQQFYDWTLLFQLQYRFSLILLRIYSFNFNTVPYLINF